VGSLLAAALARAQSFLVEPVPRTTELSTLEPLTRVPAHAEPLRLAVVGLSHESGATTVASGLAHALALSGQRSVHILALTCEEKESASRPSGVTRWEVPFALRDPREVAEYGATVERLGGGATTLVWDVSAREAERAGEAIRSSDCVIGLAAACAEPALSGLVCTMLAERYGEVLLVANRVRDPERWSGRCAAAIPESRLGALLAARGRMPGGALGVSLRRLAALVEERT
jgi:hypothetical protein